MKDNIRKFRIVNMVTILAVLLLILVGSIVRVSEAGMGCPDWPKCFGGYIPPTSEADLPADYQQAYLQKRLDKNRRLSSLLISMGFENLAFRVSNDTSIEEAHDYDPWTAWIEYVNRLIGVVIGLLILLYVWSSRKFWNNNRKITTISIAALVLVLFQGWIGSLVVSTNLLPGFISFHMGLALLLLALLVHTYFLADSGKQFVEVKHFNWVVLVLFALMVIQIFMGTGVRESVDYLLSIGTSRDVLMSQIDQVFYVHRSSSLLILVLSLYGLRALHKSGVLSSRLGFLYIVALALIGCEILGGILMAYFGVPRFVQPIHLLASASLFGLLYYLVLLTNLKTADS